MQAVWVVCRRGGDVIRAYDFPVSETLDPATILLGDEQSYIDSAKNNLSVERIAGPNEWHEFQFVVQYPAGVAHR